MNNVAHPAHYTIRLRPDLDQFIFSATTEILIHTAQPVTEITLNALDLAIWRCSCPDQEFGDCDFRMDPHGEQLTVFFPGEVHGSFTLSVEYVGRISEKMAGFYRSRFVKEGRVNTLAATQFQESDARRAFPCFDHPLKKATFSVELIIDHHLTALSNLPVAEEIPLEAGKKRVRFHPTPKMSSYLLFFGVGEFEWIEDPARVQLRVVTTPGKLPNASYALQFGRDSLEFCEQYYDLPFPLPKLDLIALPDFAFGAMENWGAITFRENLLLHYPEITSKAGEARICEVIAHEIVHQWFGNLVTPSDWKYLWLNESFATFAAFGVVDHFHPEWDVWSQFLHTQTDSALDRDGLKETCSIEIPGGQHLVINTSTAPIIYNKGGSILRQIEAYLGHDNFRDGLRHYLRQHEYACAASQDLWEAFEEIAEKPVVNIMKSWVEQPGHPLIQVGRRGGTLTLQQERFSYLPLDSAQTWQVPLAVQLFEEGGATQVITALIEDRETTLSLPENIRAYKVNAGQKGFYRVHYQDGENVRELAKLVSAKMLAPTDRWGLQNDLYALVKCGRAGLREYLEMLEAYESEDGYLPLASIRDHLFHAYLVLGTGSNKAAETGRNLYERVFERIGFLPETQEEHTTSVLRDQLLPHAAWYGSKKAERFAMEQFESLMNGDRVHPDLTKSVMQVGAWNGDEPVLRWFKERLETTESEHERMNVLTALGKFADPAILERVLDYVIKAVPQRNKFIPVVSMALNPVASPLLWDWYRSELEALEQFHPLHYERVITAILPICGLGREQEVNRFFQEYGSRRSVSEDVLQLSLERLEINSAMRSREPRR